MQIAADAFVLAVLWVLIVVDYSCVSAFPLFSTTGPSSSSSSFSSSSSSSASFFTPPAGTSPCAVSSPWNVSLSLAPLTLAVRSSVDGCHLVLSGTSTANGPSTVSMLRLTDGAVLSRWQATEGGQERLDRRDPVLLSSSSPSLVLSLVLLDANSSSSNAQPSRSSSPSHPPHSSHGLNDVEPLCVSIRAYNTSDRSSAWSASLCSPCEAGSTCTAVGSVLLFPRLSPDGSDLLLLMDSSQPCVSGELGCDPSYAWSVLHVDSGRVLQRHNTSAPVVVGTAVLHSVHGTSGVFTVTVKDRGVQSVWLHRLDGSTGSWTRLRNSTDDLAYERWTTVGAMGPVWVQQNRTANQHWRGVDVSSGKVMWSNTSEDAVLTGRWPGTIQPPYKGLSLCSSTHSHPLYASLLLTQVWSVGNDNDFISKLEAHDVYTGRVTAQSPLLGPVPLFVEDGMEHLMCPMDVQPLSPDVLVVFVEDEWYALDSTTLQPLRPGLHGRMPIWHATFQVDMKWHFVTDNSDDTMGAVLVSDDGWVYATPLNGTTTTTMTATASE